MHFIRTSMLSIRTNMHSIRTSVYIYVLCVLLLLVVVFVQVRLSTQQYTPPTDSNLVGDPFMLASLTRYSTLPPGSIQN